MPPSDVSKDARLIQPWSLLVQPPAVVRTLTEDELQQRAYSLSDLLGPARPPIDILWRSEPQAALTDASTSQPTEGEPPHNLKSHRVTQAERALEKAVQPDSVDVKLAIEILAKLDAGTLTKIGSQPGRWRDSLEQAFGKGKLDPLDYWRIRELSSGFDGSAYAKNLKGNPLSALRELPKRTAIQRLLILKDSPDLMIHLAKEAGNGAIAKEKVEGLARLCYGEKMWEAAAAWAAACKAQESGDKVAAANSVKLAVMFQELALDEGLWRDKRMNAANRVRPLAELTMVSRILQEEGFVSAFKADPCAALAAGLRSISEDKEIASMPHRYRTVGDVITETLRGLEPPPASRPAATQPSAAAHS